MARSEAEEKGESSDGVAEPACRSTGGCRGIVLLASAGQELRRGNMKGHTWARLKAGRRES